ncbi:MAG: TolC family protein [Bacteroidaceae bacterium]|nr:TolC family protein [Bacteroidaceae bacterium]
MKSKGRRLFLCLMASIMAMGTKAQESVQTESVGTLDLNLEKAIEIALAENPTIKVADKDIELKKVADKEAWQALLPEVNVTGNLQHTLLAAEMKLNTPAGTQKFKMGQDGTNTVAAAATLSMPLFAPAIYQNMKLTKADIKLAQEKARSSRLDLINQVSKAYYQALLAKDSYEVMQKSFKTSKQNYEVVEKKFNVGRVSEYDKISAEVQMRSMESALTSAQTGMTLAMLQLKVLMGVTENVDLNINDQLKNYENQLVLPESYSFSQELQNNSALRQFELNKNLLERTLKVQRTRFMPTLSFQLTGQYQSLYNDDWELWNYDYAPSSSFTLVLSIPIFKASNWTALKKTKIQLGELEDNRLNTQRQLNMAAESYNKNMASSIAQVASNHEAVKQADKAVTISAKRYEVGRGTILELNQSEVALTQAKLTYSQSIYDYLKNRADLDYTLGRETYLK